MSANRPRRAPARRRPTAGPAKQRPARAQRPAREPESPPETLFLATIPGATPSKWVDRFTSRARTVQLLNHDQSAQAAHLAHDPDGAARFALPPLGYLRWPGDGEPADVLRAAGVAPEHVHVVRLYQEAAVVCVGTDHLLAAWDADADGPVPLTELDPAEAYSPVDFAPPAPQDPLEVPEVPGSGERTVLEIVATGAGHAVLPMSVARMFGRKDVVVLPVQTSVGMEDD
ncbi:MAG: hypothetical protein Q4G34_05335, partial [Micrococcus sp.]|nr:hypothetical protein [Micrococcus sp.]